MFRLSGLLATITLAGLVSAQSPVYGQCGGIGWTGATTCVSGSTCVYSNDYYSQCVPGAATTTTKTTTTASSSTSTGSTSTAKPTVYLAGDSTMTAAGNNDGTAGWGVYLSSYINLPIVNDAIAGRSARSFTREGRFTTMAQSVKAGDYVIIEFGHNDGGSLSPTDNGRTDCNPVNNNYATTCQTTYNGVQETVLTFEAYLVNAAKLFQSKGANVIISGATPNNVCEGGSYVYSSSRFVQFTSDAAKATNSVFVDHGQTTADAYKAVGCTVTNSYYPHDHTHTSPAGANTVAKAFATGLKATSSTLKQYLK